VLVSTWVATASCKSSYLLIVVAFHGGWPGKIIGFCGGVRFPKVDLAQVLVLLICGFAF